ncbi:MAG: hypothetical protein E6G44_09425 [Actinobacteria bacterium]|nr:MAG: hypothetical protein E6G44_09425 [Actinomycetota bacterium]
MAAATGSSAAIVNVEAPSRRDRVRTTMGNPGLLGRTKEGNGRWPGIPESPRSAANRICERYSGVS